METKKNKFLQEGEDRITALRIIGFVLVILGILTFCIAAMMDEGAIVAVAFFITMLGFAFALPKLLEGNDGLSTMRIVVFMMINVICLLLLKIGWGKNSLKEIGLDEWWMGVIAFVFGAKATQTYFENKLRLKKEDPASKTTESVDGAKDVEKIV